MHVPMICAWYHYVLSRVRRRSDGLQIASAGKDTAVRVYDEARMELVATLGHSDAEMRRYEGMSGGAVGHTSRCFSVRFVPDDPNLLLSAGWDNTSVHIL